MSIRSLIALAFLVVSATAKAQTITAQPVRTFAHAAEGRETAFTPDSQLLATSSVDKTVKLWRVADGKLVRTLTHPEGVACIDISPDGQWLASGSYDNA